MNYLKKKLKKMKNFGDKNQKKLNMIEFLFVKTS